MESRAEPAAQRWVPTRGSLAPSRRAGVLVQGGDGRMMLPRLLLLTDRAQLPPGQGLVHTVVECVQAGLTHVIVRELDQPPGDRPQLIKTLAAVPGLTVISAHRPHPDAAGVHLAATQQRLPEWWHGRSCHTAAQVEQAADDEGAAYVTLAPFAVAASTPGGGRPVDPAEFRGHRTRCSRSAASP